MNFQKLLFRQIRIDGVSYDHDTVTDRGEVRKRKKKPHRPAVHGHALEVRPMFEEAISARKAELWYRIDRRLDLMINLRLAADKPVLGTTR